MAVPYSRAFVPPWSRFRAMRPRAAGTLSDQTLLSTGTLVFLEARRRYWSAPSQRYRSQTSCQARGATEDAVYARLAVQSRPKAAD
jgi:hypothetical protein